jgi:uncharacterized iron-regulated membrane protein
MKLSHHNARKARKVFFFIHLWTGVILGLWFVMIGLTGSSLAWPELIAAEMKAMFPYQKTSANEPQIPISQAIAAIKKAQPDISAQELSLVIVPNYRFPYYIFTRNNKKFHFTLFLVDPYSGKVNPPRQVIDFTTGKLEQLHMNLVLAAKGLITNGILSVFILFLLLTGLWLWWPSTLRQLKLRLSFKRGAPLRRLLMDLHNMMGIYLYLILLVTTVTAILMVANDATNDGIEGPEPKALMVKPNGNRLPDDFILQRAHAILPDSDFLFVERPVHADDAYQIHFERRGFGILRAGILWLNPYSGSVLKIDRDSQSSGGRKGMAIVESLHLGLYGGVLIQILYTLAGFMPLGLFITGLMMWWKRKRQSTKVKSLAAK